MKYLWNNSRPFSFLFLLTLPLYFILDANNKYWTLIPGNSSVKILLLMILGAVILFSFLRFFFEENISLIITVWLMLNYLFFKPIKNFVASFQYFHFLNQYKYYIQFFFLGTLILLYLIITFKRDLQKVCVFLNSVFLIILFYEAIVLIRNSIEYKPEPITTEDIVFTPFIAVDTPNIFLFILDEYAGMQSLKQNYDFDNLDFHNELQRRNFYVPSEPNCNYNSTVFSVLSLLDMGYLKNLRKEEVKNVNAFSKAASGIQKNQLTQFFINSGYTFINNSFFRINNSSSSPTLFLPLADRLATNKTFGDVLWYDLLSNIPNNSLQDLLQTYESRTDKYNQKVKQRIESAIISEQNKPVFAYSHFFMPHGPYLRNEDGTKRNFSLAHNERSILGKDSAYIGYLKYTNKIMLEIVDGILEHKSNSIIILISDHGNRYKRDPKMKESDFNNFLAVYAPDKQFIGLSDTVSLVNLFRIVLNERFDQQLPLIHSNQRIDVNSYLR